MLACPQCGKLNPENFNYCLDCGAELHPDTAHSAESHFIISLSADANDVEETKAAQPGATPKIASGATPIPAEAKPGRPETVSLKPGETVLELSPDDLLDSATEVKKPEEAAKPAKPVRPLEIELEEDVFESPERTLFQIDPKKAQVGALSVKKEKTLIPSDLKSEDLLLPVEDVEEAGGLDLDMEVDMSQAEEIRCVKCGAVLTGKDRFCGQCGTPVGAGVEESAGKTMFMHIPSTEPSEALPVAKLTVLEPTGREGRTFNLVDGENLVGRTKGAILLDDKLVSPTHCTFTHSNGQMTLKDIGSLNGVFIKVKGEIELPSKTVFRVGQQLLVYYSINDFEALPNPSAGDETLFMGSPVGSLWGKLLRVNKNGRVAMIYSLNKPMLSIGRENGDISFPDDGFVSGNHAKLSFRENRCYLADLGSSNGTFLKIGGELALHNNDLLLVGKKLMRFEYM